MKISNISALSFKAETQNSVKNDKKQESSKKGFLCQKEAPYIIGGVAVTAAVILGIVGHKNGWFSKGGKKIVKNANETVSENIGNKPSVDTSSVNPKGSSQEIPHTPESAAQVQEPAPAIVNFGPWDDSELLGIGACVAKNEAIVEETLEPVIKMNPYDIFSQFLKDSYLTEERTVSENLAEKLKMFFDKIDTKVTGYIRQIHENFLVDNFNGDGSRYRYKNDYISAFDFRIKNGMGSFKDAVYEVLGNSVRLTKSDGKRFMYTFFPGEKGGLKYITEIPKEGENTAIRLTYYPTKYAKIGASGINSLAKMEYINTKTHRVIESVAIHPKNRVEQKLIVNNPETGKRVLSWYRSSEPDNMYYNAILYEDGVPCVHIDTKNNVLEKINKISS